MSFITNFNTKVISTGCRYLFLSQKRFNRREAIHRYHEPNKFKKHMLSATQPYYRKEFVLTEETCRGYVMQETPLHPLEKIYVNELVDKINQSNFLLFVQYTYTIFQNDRVYRNTITKTGSQFNDYNNKVYKEALNILGRNQATHLLVTRNALITGTYESLPKCILSLNKMPEYILLCGYIDDHLYNIDQLKLITSMKDLNTSRANLVATLTTPSINLYSYLETYTDQNKTNSEKD